MKKGKDHYKLLRLQDERIQQLETIISSQKEEIALLRELAEQLKEKTRSRNNISQSCMGCCGNWAYQETKIRQKGIRTECSTSMWI